MPLGVSYAGIIPRTPPRAPPRLAAAARPPRGPFVAAGAWRPLAGGNAFWCAFAAVLVASTLAACQSPPHPPPPPRRWVWPADVEQYAPPNAGCGPDGKREAPRGVASGSGRSGARSAGHPSVRLQAVHNERNALKKNAPCSARRPRAHFRHAPRPIGWSQVACENLSAIVKLQTGEGLVGNWVTTRWGGSPPPLDRWGARAGVARPVAALAARRAAATRWAPPGGICGFPRLDESRAPGCFLLGRRSRVACREGGGSKIVAYAVLEAWPTIKKTKNAVIVLAGGGGGKGEPHGPCAIILGRKTRIHPTGALLIRLPASLLRTPIYGPCAAMPASPHPAPVAMSSIGLARHGGSLAWVV